MTIPPWHAVCTVDQLSPGTPHAARVQGQRLVLVLQESGDISIFDDACPHEGYPLSKGTVVDGELVCPWHNFRFSVATGACRKGDEDAHPLPVHIEDGVVHVDLTPPPLTERVARLQTSLVAAALELRLGQVARDLVRLLRLGVSPDELLALAVWTDARHAEWGTSHVLPVAADVRTRARQKADGDRPEAAAEVLWPVFQLLGESHPRRPVRTHPEATASVDLDTFAEDLRAQISAEDTVAAEALVRGAVAAGASIDQLQRALLGCCADHFLGFGHPLIYTVKLGQLPPLSPPQLADVAGALAFRVANATREDSVPEWRPVHRWLDEHAVALAAVAEGWAEAGRNPLSHHWRVDRAEWLKEAENGHWKAVLDHTLAQLELGATPADLGQLLVQLGTTRLLRFNVAHDADITVQEGWLDVTHRLTTPVALWDALGLLDWSDWLRLALLTLVWTVHAAPLDGPEPNPGPPHGDLPALLDALSARNLPAALGALDRVGASPDLLSALVDASLDDAAVRGIVVAHLVKTCVAAHEASMAHGDLRPLQAALKLLMGPVSEARGRRLVHEARRLVVEGRVPRTLT